MIRFLLKRLFWFGITVFAVMAVSFLLMKNVKGGPFDSERNVDETVLKNLEARYHLDWPLYKQFLQYVGPFNLDDRGVFGSRERVWGGALTGDLGPSFKYADFTVNQIIAASFPVSMLLGSMAMLWALLLGVSTGVVSALRRGSFADLALRLFATLGIAVPNFVIAAFLLLLFSFELSWFPSAGWGTIQHMILPSFALGAPFAAYISRLTRTGMLEVLSHDYIRTAVAKGMPPRIVLFRHAIRGGLLPVVSYLGPATAGILTGSLVIESVFGISGMGQHFVQSALNRDYTLAMGVTILYTVLVFGLNTLVDLAYTLLDPRIDLEGE